MKAYLIAFGGIQLLSLGIMGEYVGRIYEEVKNRPAYIVESDLGFDPSVARDQEDALAARLPY